jgi:hypothetical protein
MQHVLTANPATAATASVPWPGLSERFYERLFRAIPDLREFFPADMRQQYQQLDVVLSALARHEDSLDAIEPMLLDLGAQYAELGMRPVHIELARNQLLEAILEGGPDDCGAAGTFWPDLICCAAAVMLRGAALIAPVAPRSARRRGALPRC